MTKTEKIVIKVQSIGNNFITPAQSLCLNDVAVPLTGTIPTGGTGSYVYELDCSKATTSKVFNFNGSILIDNGYIKNWVKENIKQLKNDWNILNKRKLK
jgi:hypothetical protein